MMLETALLKEQKAQTKALRDIARSLRKLAGYPDDRSIGDDGSTQ